MIMSSQIRQNFKESSERGINEQINKELYASYVYQAMSFHFDRDDVALFGFSNFFHKQSLEERCHAEKLMKYQNKRGGQIVLNDILKPTQTHWTPESAFVDALALEKEVNQSLLDLHKVAETNNDPQMMDFLEKEYLEEQVESIKLIGDYLTNIRRNQPGLGVYLFDKMTLKD